MLNHIVKLLQQKGYVPFREKGILLHETEDMINIVTLSVFNKLAKPDDYYRVKTQAEFTAATTYRKPVQTLHLVFTEDGMFEEDVIQFVEMVGNVWLIALDTGRIYLFENQSDEFDGLYPFLEQNLKNIKVSKKKIDFRFTPVNMAIVLLNIFIFLFIVFSKGFDAVYDTNSMLSMGASSAESFLNGRWYEVITSLFLHFGISHLLNNMFLLVYVGCELENRIGSLQYFMLYMLSGIFGNLTSLWYYYNTGQNVVSAGASGAIFGVIGALFIVLLKKGKSTQNLTPKRLLILACITIYYGMTTVGVDNAAHIGGLLSGLFGGLLLSKISQYGKLK